MIYHLYHQIDYLISNCLFQMLPLFRARVYICVWVCMGVFLFLYLLVRLLVCVCRRMCVYMRVCVLSPSSSQRGWNLSDLGRDNGQLHSPAAEANDLREEPNWKSPNYIKLKIPFSRPLSFHPSTRTARTGSAEPSDEITKHEAMQNTVDIKCAGIDNVLLFLWFRFFNKRGL